MEIFFKHSQWNECSSSQRFTSLSAVVHWASICTIDPTKTNSRTRYPVKTCTETLAIRTFPSHKMSIKLPIRCRLYQMFGLYRTAAKSPQIVSLGVLMKIGKPFVSLQHRKFPTCFRKSHISTLWRWTILRCEYIIMQFKIRTFRLYDV